MDYNVWSIIADYIPAHPQRYTRLAQVSKSFHRLFTSDNLWTKLDFYEVKDHISQHYLMRRHNFSAIDKRRLTHANFVELIKPAPIKCTDCEEWSTTERCSYCRHWKRKCCNHIASACAHCGLLKSVTDSANDYVAFIVVVDYPGILPAKIKSFLTNRVRNRLIKEYGPLKFATETDYGDTHLIERALVKNPMALQYAPDKVRNNVDLVCLAMRGDPRAHKYIDNDIRNEPKICQTRLKIVRLESGAQTLCT